MGVQEQEEEEEEERDQEEEAEEGEEEVERTGVAARATMVRMRKQGEEATIITTIIITTTTIGHDGETKGLQEGGETAVGEEVTKEEGATGGGEHTKEEDIFNHLSMRPAGSSRD